MLDLKHRSGFTLVELAITLAILAILATLGLPSFLGMLESGRIKAAASGFAMGLQRARAEAISRGQTVRFVPAASGAGWFVSTRQLEDPHEYDPVACPDLNSLGADVRATVVNLKCTGESGGAQIILSATTVIGFNNLGRATTGAPATFNFSGPSGCSAEPRCLRVQVSTSGQVRLCDPAVTVTTDTRSCGS